MATNAAYEYAGSAEKLKNYSISAIDMYVDSTTFCYSHGYKWNDKSYFGLPAKYKGDLKNLENQISRDITSSYDGTPIDSVLVYEAVISLSDAELGRTAEEKFELKRLLFGKESVYSAIVAERLRAKETNYFDDGQPKWAAAIQGSSGRRMETKIKIYVRLNKDGSVTIKLPKMLGNFTGD